MMKNITNEVVTLIIREIVAEEIDEVIALVWLVFMQYVAPDYSKEGSRTFQSFIQDKERMKALTIYGAFDEEEMVGVLAIRETAHISLFFVKDSYQGQKVGRKLFEYMLEKNDDQTFSVNASPYAVPIYRHLGFKDEKPQQEEDGIIFTPMTYRR